VDGTRDRHVGGPGETLPGDGPQLNLDDDRMDRDSVVIQQDDKVERQNETSSEPSPLRSALHPCGISIVCRGFLEDAGCGVSPLFSDGIPNNLRFERQLPFLR
jgi:hypothetical protein